MGNCGKKVFVICGGGAGKTNVAIGRGIQALADGKTVTLIRFLQGKANAGLMNVLKRLEPEMKAFSFETYEGLFEDLTEDRKQEELVNLRNSLGFARKVLMTNGCDVLILDELLGLVELGVLSTEELEQLIRTRPEAMELVITGKVFPEAMKDEVDCVSRIESTFHSGWR